MVHPGRSSKLRRTMGRAARALAAGLVVLTLSSSPVMATARNLRLAPALGHAISFVTVPSVTGISLAAAVRELDAAKLKVFVRTSSATGRVYQQSPVAGTRVLIGAAVSVWARRVTAPSGK